MGVGQPIPQHLSGCEGNWIDFVFSGLYVDRHVLPSMRFLHKRTDSILIEIFASTRDLFTGETRHAHGGFSPKLGGFRAGLEVFVCLASHSPPLRFPLLQERREALLGVSADGILGNDVDRTVVGGLFVQRKLVVEGSLA